MNQETAERVLPWVFVLVPLLALGGYVVWHTSDRNAREASARHAARQETARRTRPAGHPAVLPGARAVETAHYTITTTADDEQTRRIGDAVEALHAAYMAWFPGLTPRPPGAAKFRLTLYATRSQFHANNYSSSWAEAYYLRPVSYAYYAAGESNPHHWMVHEATHQLNEEVARFPKTRWIEEGLGTYFGASRIENGRLVPGRIAYDAYPVWWLDRMDFSGSLDEDLRTERWIPLRAIVSGRNAPPLGSRVNLYYIQYWSLTHFLFHHDHGRHADAYRRLIAEGGTLKNFERLIGPVERVEREWYRYLQDRIEESPPR